MNIRELIIALEEAAKEYGDFTPVLMDAEGIIYEVDNVYEYDGEVFIE